LILIALNIDSLHPRDRATNYCAHT